MLLLLLLTMMMKSMMVLFLTVDVVVQGKDGGSHI